MPVSVHIKRGEGERKLREFMMGCVFSRALEGGANSPINVLFQIDWQGEIQKSLTLPLRGLVTYQKSWLFAETSTCFVIHYSQYETSFASPHFAH